MGDIFRDIVECEKFKLKYIKKDDRNTWSRVVRINGDFTQFLSTVFLAWLEYPFEVLKALRLFAHGKHEDPLREISDECDNVPRTTDRSGIQRMNKIRVSRSRWSI